MGKETPKSRRRDTNDHTKLLSNCEFQQNGCDQNTANQNAARSKIWNDFRMTGIWGLQEMPHMSLTCLFLKCFNCTAPKDPAYNTKSSSQLPRLLPVSRPSPVPPPVDDSRWFPSVINQPLHSHYLAIVDHQLRL